MYFEILKEAGVPIAATLKDYLAEGKDTFYVLNECKENLTPTRIAFSEYLEQDGKIKYSPMQTIFVENSSSELKDANGNPLVSWN